MTPAQARAAIHAMATCPGFHAAYRASAGHCYRMGARPPLTAPTTVAFGSRDLILLPGLARHLDELPPGTRVGELPGCGHVPLADDPAAVAALITASARVRDRPA
ncbi:MAG TPA: hypothetical protein VFV66_20450 [Nonomuraea sp.]|nr:hypothetical protein [Nonomuraea sp.]